MAARFGLLESEESGDVGLWLESAKGSPVIVLSKNGSEYRVPASLRSLMMVLTLKTVQVKNEDWGCTIVRQKEEIAFTFWESHGYPGLRLCVPVEAYIDAVDGVSAFVE